MSKKLYSSSDEWILIEGQTAKIGITEYAQQQLGDIVFIELPEVGTTIEKDGSMGAVESVKAAADLYSPVAGKVTAVNEALIDQPELLNASAEDTFIVELSIEASTDLSHLMNEDAYLASK
jgi:glycine cleavage system H protein